MYVGSIPSIKSGRNCISFMNIILIGPPGSGKSTQGTLLAEKLNIPYFSAGQILREKAKENNEEAQTIRKYIDMGDLVPDSMMLPIIESRTRESKGFVLDGFPRKIEQAKAFDQHIDKVIYIDLPDKEALWRIAKRIDKRNDQSAATILHRLQVFHQQTDEVIEHYRDQGKLIQVDGMPSIEEIHKEILQKLP
jgi:adenylate kinase